MSRTVKHRKPPKPLWQIAANVRRAKCPRPDKKSHRTLKGAELAAEKQWLRDRRIVKPYACGDHFHLTSQGCTR